MAKWNLLYDLYEKRLCSDLPADSIPQHIGIILDGNRRWAKSTGTTASQGHRAGAGKIGEVLEWADELGVKIVTLWMLSTDNLGRTSTELTELFRIIADAVASLAARRKWRIALVGDLALLPDDIAAEIRASIASTDKIAGMCVNVAIGYGGRHEITEAVRAILRDADARGVALADLAESLKDSDITDHLYTKDQPDPDLVIRTSGEQRLSGFMIWQSVHSEFYFCDAYWPDFRRVDFLRALRSYAQRERRRGK